MEITTPYYIVYEERIRRNLDLITDVARRADVEIIMAFKANALWRTFGVLREYGIASTASSVNEMLLGNDYLGRKVHTYCPVYTPETIAQFIDGSSHIVFNSLAQYERYHSLIAASGHDISCGLRINPKLSLTTPAQYDPCAPGSRFGVAAADLPDKLPEGIEGFHFHDLCESMPAQLEQLLDKVEADFGKYLDRLKWINMGGGHLMTHRDYNCEKLITLLQEFKRRHPGLHVVLEPGSAFMWQTGDLIVSVLDVVESDGIATAIIDASFACHMPDCLEMPYKPAIKEALPEVQPGMPTYRLGGNSCLSGDFVGDWSFEQPLHAGQRLTLQDMNHYTTVKTTMFNGIQHPDIWYRHLDGTMELLRHFTYEDYRDRMS